MNLRDIINYRKNCLICGGELELSSYLPNFQTIVTEDDVTVSHQNRSIHYNWDGSFKTYGMRKSLYDVMKFSKFCRQCSPDFKLPRNYGRSSATEMMDARCYYVFDILADRDTRQHLISINYEYVSVIHNDVLFHLETSYHLKESILYYGDTVNHPLRNLLHKTIPMVNIQTIPNLESLSTKIKLFAAFS